VRWRSKEAKNHAKRPAAVQPIVFTACIRRGRRKNELDRCFPHRGGIAAVRVPHHAVLSSSDPKHAHNCSDETGRTEMQQRLYVQLIGDLLLELIDQAVRSCCNIILDSRHAVFMVMRRIPNKPRTTNNAYIIVHGIYVHIYTTYVVLHVHVIDRVLDSMPTTEYVLQKICRLPRPTFPADSVCIRTCIYICMYTHPANAYVHVRCRR